MVGDPFDIGRVDGLAVDKGRVDGLAVDKGRVDGVAVDDCNEGLVVGVFDF